jgi:hypothetical protein
MSAVFRNARWLGAFRIAKWGRGAGKLRLALVASLSVLVVAMAYRAIGADKVVSTYLSSL